MTSSAPSEAAPRMAAFTNDGLRFTVVDTGPEQGAPILLLHGFPQHGESWRATAEMLNTSGHRTLVPDQRGYCPDALPARRSDYRIDKLVGDVVALIQQAGLGPVHLVGHDWGAAVAWATAATHPDLVLSLTAVSVPHPLGFLKSMLSSRQALMSWYMVLFQLPRVPEKLFGSTDFGYQRLIASGQEPALARRDLEYLEHHGGITGALNWYRALPYSLTALQRLRQHVTVPTLQVWSDGDTAVNRKGHTLSSQFVDARWRLVALARVSHWIPDECPEELADLIDRHIRAR